MNNPDQEKPKDPQKLPQNEETHRDFSVEHRENTDGLLEGDAKNNKQKWAEIQESNISATLKINLPNQDANTEASSVEKVMELQGLEFPALPFPVQLDLLPNKECWDKYSILGVMAEQTHRSLLLARDENVHRLVVMKVLRFSVNLEKYHMQRFLEEAQILGQLEHPAIVPLHEIGIDGEGQLYCTMRYLSGCTLAQCLSQKNIQNYPRKMYKQLLLCFRQICQALAYVHQHGIYHRNLTPENIWLDQNREPYVLGWSLCRVKDRGTAIFDNSANENVRQTGKLQTIEGRHVGNLYYIAPEMLVEKMRYADERADIYALGGILYYMMSGRHPFQGATVAESIQNICQRKRSLPAKTFFPISRSLRRLIYKAMAIARTERYQSVEEMIDELDRLVLQKQWLYFL
jgi:serine/threonine protein kinase